MSTEILEGFSSTEKAAYITAIASIATADQSASAQEMQYLGDLADTVGLSDAEKQQVTVAATETSGESLKKALDVLKTSELKYSLVADLIAFAESDNNVVEQEKKHIASVASYLDISADQLQALNEYVQEAASQPAEAMGFLGGGQEGGGIGGILDNLGLGQKLQNSGINIGSLSKGLMSFIGPMVLGKMLNKGMQSPGGASGALGGGNLSSIIGSITGGQGFGKIGGFLSNLLK
jgi:uncharacterized tellurite resistance protein B-like protein